MMFRVTITGSFCLLVLSLCGCTSFFTKRAIESFTAGLVAGDLTELQANTSAEFQQRALRVAEAVDSLAVLPLPRDNWQVKEVEEISADEQLVTVETGKPPQTTQYRLKRVTTGGLRSTRKWVVDDVILTQSRPGGQPPLTKSVTDQMDLLITVQEFLKTWRGGSREETLARVHPDLQAELDALAPVHLAQITDLMLEGVKLDHFRPEAQIRTNRATVKFPKPGGNLVLDMVRVDEPESRWVVRDATVHSTRGGQPQSVTHLARCLGPVAEFLRAYAEGDKETLQRLASTTFYKHALAPADLKSVPLPIPQLLATRFELEEHDRRVDVVFDVGQDTYLLSMTRERNTEPVLKGQEGAEPPCRIDEVTIYERGGTQIKPLSVAFTAQAVVEIFAESLAAADLPLLVQLSTPDFNQQVWQRFCRPELMRGLPLDVVPDAPPEVVTTVFLGPVTEVTVTQGARALTYVLHATGGRPQVDDIRFAADNRSGSLKTICSVLAPIYNFAWGWGHGDMDVLTQNSSDGLRRMIWSQTSQVPAIPVALDTFLARTPPRIEDLAGDLLVTVGPPDRGLQVRLVPEQGRLMVEDLHVIGRELPQGKIELVNAMRTWITAERSRPTPRTAAPRSRTDLVAPLAVAPQAESPPSEGAGTAVLPAGTAQLPVPPASTPASELPTPTPAPDTRPLLQQPIKIPGA